MRFCFPNRYPAENDLPPSFRRREVVHIPDQFKAGLGGNRIHPSFRWSWRRSAIMAMNSLLVGFPLTLETV